MGYSGRKVVATLDAASQWSGRNMERMGNHTAGKAEPTAPAGDGASGGPAKRCASGGEFATAGGCFVCVLKSHSFGYPSECHGADYGRRRGPTGRTDSQSVVGNFALRHAAIARCAGRNGVGAGVFHQIVCTVAESV